MRKLLATALLAVFSLNANALSILHTGYSPERDVVPRLESLGHTVDAYYNTTFMDENFDYSPYDLVVFGYAAAYQGSIPGLVDAVDNGEVGVVFFRSWGVGELAQAFGMSGGEFDWQYATESGTDKFDVTNNNHYITQGLNLGINELGYTYMNYSPNPGPNASVLANGDDGAALLVHNSLRVAIAPFYGHEDGYELETAESIAMTERTLQWAAGAGPIGVVPIPAAAWLFGSALLGLGWVRRLGR